MRTRGIRNTCFTFPLLLHCESRSDKHQFKIQRPRSLSCEVCSGEPVYLTTAWRHIQRSKKAKFANEVQDEIDCCSLAEPESIETEETETVVNFIVTINFPTLCYDWYALFQQH